MAKRPDGLVRAFGMSGLQITSQLTRIENDFGIDLGHNSTTPKGRKAAEYEQFEAALRKDALRMSEFYEVFFCLENSIRKLVADIMIDAEGADWWASALMKIKSACPLQTVEN